MTSYANKNVYDGERVMTPAEREPMTTHRDAERVIEKALDLCGGDRAIVDDWLSRRIPALAGQRPVDLMATESGCKLVLDTLGRIEHGVYA